MMQSPQTPPIRTVSPLVRYQSAERCALQHEVAQPLPGLQEIRIVLGSATCAWLFLALISFNSADASFFNVVFPVLPLSNWCGWLGAQCASWLFVLFGPGAWALWAMACNAIMPKPDMRLINNVVQTVAGGLIIASLSLLSAALSGAGSTIGAGLLGATLFNTLEVVGVVGCVLLGAAVLFFSTIVFLRLTLNQFFAKVAMAAAYAAIVILTVARLFASGVRSLFGREQKEVRHQPSPMRKSVEQQIDELYDIPETEIVSNAVHSSIIKEKNQSSHPAAVVVEEIAEASNAILDDELAEEEFFS